MTPQEKAKQLVRKYKDLVRFDHTYDEKPIFECQKRCAIILCNEIIAEFKSQLTERVVGHYKIDYWKEVKQEIINL